MEFKVGDLVKLIPVPRWEYMGLSLFQENQIMKAAPWLVDLRGKRKSYFLEDPPLLFLGQEEKKINGQSIFLYHFLWENEKWYYLEEGYDNIPIDQIFYKVSQ